MSDTPIVPDKIVYEVAHGLLGQCLESINSLLEDKGYSEDDLQTRQFAIIDEITFLCPACGWWCETGDYAEFDGFEDVCSDCGSDRDDE